MNKYLLILPILANTAQAHAQKGIVAEAHNLQCDSTRKDFSKMDMIFLITKVIHPGSFVEINNDTIWYHFDVPNAFVDSARLIYARNVAYDATSIAAFRKDSMKEKIIAFEVCENPKNCITWFYRLKDHHYRKYTIKEKIELLVPSFYWPTEVGQFMHTKKQKSIILFHKVDTSSKFGQPAYVKNFHGFVSTLIGDIVYKSKAASRKRYRYLISIFYAGNKLLSYYRVKLNDPDFPKNYRYKFFESTRIKSP